MVNIGTMLNWKRSYDISHWNVTSRLSFPSVQTNPFNAECNLIRIPFNYSHLWRHRWNKNDCIESDDTRYWQCPQIRQRYGKQNKEAIALQCISNVHQKLNSCSCLALYCRLIWGDSHDFSYMLLFRRLLIPKVPYPEGSLFQRFVIPNRA